MSLVMSGRALADAGTAVAETVAALPWPAIEAEIDERGYATVGPLLSPGAMPVDRRAL